MVTWTPLMAAVCTLTAVASSPLYQNARDLQDSKHNPLLDTRIQEVCEKINRCWNFKTIYGGLGAEYRNRVVVPARQATHSGGSIL